AELPQHTFGFRVVSLSTPTESRASSFPLLSNWQTWHSRFGTLLVLLILPPAITNPFPDGIEAITALSNPIAFNDAALSHFVCKSRLTPRTRMSISTAVPVS